MRRGVIAFNLSAIPANAVVSSATLTMNLSKTGPDPDPVNVSVSRALSNWGEGASNAGNPGGAGTQALAGDATWLHTFYNTSFWTTPGGDFSATPSATTAVSVDGATYQWTSSQLIADVQAWIANSSGNFGWVIRGNELTPGSAARFRSRQSSTNPPQLYIVYQVPTPTPTPTPAVVATITLPTATINTSVTNVTQPVMATTFNSSNDLVGFQGDFFFNETIVTFQNPPVSPAGLTGTNWNVSGNILPGSGPIRTLRVSAFSNDFTPLSGSGVLYNLNMVRVSSTPGASTALTWDVSPHNLSFISSKLNTYNPGSTPPGSVTIQTSTISIAGSISYCSNPVPGPVSGVQLNLTGTSSGSVTSDGSGNYTFSSLSGGGSYTVTPTKTPLSPGAPSITTVDVVATQRHFLNIAPIPAGCRLTAADVNGDLSVTTVDVIAIQRFFLGYTTGIANTGKYQFTPSTRTYTAPGNNQTGQNYDALVLGDVASPFAGRDGGPSPDRADEPSRK